MAADTTLVDVGVTPHDPAVSLERHGVLLALLLFAVTAIIGVLARPPLPIDETRYLAVAWEMWTSGTWLVPHLNGEVYSDKPPLLFWLINLAWSVTGVSETAARLVAPMFGLGTIAVTARIARILWPDDPAIGGLAALILSGFASFALFAGLTMFDAMLAFSVAVGILSILHARTSRLGFLGLGLALTLGGLSKGPVVLVLLLPAALLMPLWSRTSSSAALAGTLLAVGVGLATMALWLVPALMTGGPAYREAILWTQSAGRVVDSFAHQRPFWFYLAVLPAMIWPFGWDWSYFTGRTFRGVGADEGLRLVALWAVVPLLLLSAISGKQVHYLLPLLPAGALAFARLFGKRALRARLAAVVPAVFAVALAAVSTGLVPLGELAGLAQPGWVFALGGLAAAALAVACYRLSGTVLVLVGPAVVIVGDLLLAVGVPGRVYNPEPMAEILAAHDKAGIAIFNGDYNGEFTFTARLSQPVMEVRGAGAVATWMADHPGGALIARLERPHPATPPDYEILFRNRPYGIWLAPTDPSQGS